MLTFLLIIITLLAQRRNADFNALYLFHAETCLKDVFYDDSGTLGPWLSSNTDCISTIQNLELYPDSENGVVLPNSLASLNSTWNMASVLSNNFDGNFFSIAVWFQNSFNLSSFSSNQILFRIEKYLTLTPNGFEMSVGGSVTVGDANNLLPPCTDVGWILIIVSVGLKQGHIWRKSLETNIVSQNSFNFPESYFQRNQVVIPRMSSWSPSAIAEISFTGTLGYLQLFNYEVVNQGLIFDQGAPNSKPICPSFRDVIHQVSEYSQITDLTSSLQVSVLNNSWSYNQILFKIESLPNFGILLGDQNVEILHLPVYTQTLKYQAFYGSLIQQNDSFFARAVPNNNYNCESPYEGEISIEVLHVNLPPLPTNLSIESSIPFTQFYVYGINPNTKQASAYGGDSHIYLFWGEVSGNIIQATTCLNHQAEDQQIPTNFIETRNGTGWPLSFCYYPNYSSSIFVRSSGEKFVGQEILHFYLYDQSGQISGTFGTITINVLNPVIISPLSSDGIEGKVLSLQFPMNNNWTRIWISSLPSFGNLSLNTNFAPLLNPGSSNAFYSKAIYYLSMTNYWGKDQFFFKFEANSGYVSPPISYEVNISNTYHPSRFFQSNFSVQIFRCFQRTLITNVKIENVDLDAYSSELQIFLNDSSSGMVSIQYLSSEIIVVSGSSCVDVGCQEPIILIGVASLLKLAIQNLEYTSLNTVNNVIYFQIFDEFSNNFTIADETFLNIDYVGVTVWGNNLSVRGNRTIGAAIVGGFIAFVLVFGRGIWSFLPLSLRNFCSKRVCISSTRNQQKVKQDPKTTESFPEPILKKQPIYQRNGATVEDINDVANLNQNNHELGDRSTDDHVQAPSPIPRPTKPSEDEMVDTLYLV